MSQSTTIPFGFDESSFIKRSQWMKNNELNWQSCSPELNGSMRGLIENHIGQISIPLGLAGPCVINGTYAEGTYYIPIACLEGTLALSMTRGFSAANACGGICTQHVKQEISRSPIFSFHSFNDLKIFLNWITKHFSDIKTVAEQSTRHGRLLRIDPYQIHDHLILDFVYDTAEAAGQNMITFCTHEACEYILAQMSPQITLTYKIESNFSADKNPSTKTLLTTRGHKVVASCILSAEICNKILRCQPDKLVQGWNLGRYGSALANTTGVNLHVANALTAIYLATGQDCACVAENANGLFDMIYFADSNTIQFVLTLPSITVGTIGGGTLLPQQNTNLKLINCLGQHSSKRLAELICASALALEISLAASIFSNTFVKAHRILGRKKKKN